MKEVRETRDPIQQIRQRILDDGEIMEEALSEVDAEIKSVVVAAAKFAEDAPEPGSEELYSDVYVERNE